jgi:hypothetical protein
MSINTKIRLTILASAFALAAAAPVAFAQGSGTWYQGIHTDPGATADAPAGRHSKDVMEKRIAPIAMAPNTGTWYQGFHTDPGGVADAPAGRHSKEVMEKKSAPGGMASGATTQFGVPAY